MHHNFSEDLVSITLSVCAGLFIYFAANEIIIEEFSVTQYKFSKFFTLLGGVLLYVIGHLTEDYLISTGKLPQKAI